MSAAHRGRYGLAEDIRMASSTLLAATPARALVEALGLNRKLEDSFRQLMLEAADEAPVGPIERATFASSALRQLEDGSAKIVKVAAETLEEGFVSDELEELASFFGSELGQRVVRSESEVLETIQDFFEALLDEEELLDEEDTEAVLADKTVQRVLASFQASEGAVAAVREAFEGFIESLEDDDDVPEHTVEEAREFVRDDLGGFQDGLLASVGLAWRSRLCEADLLAACDFMDTALGQRFVFWHADALPVIHGRLERWLHDLLEGAATAVVG